MVSVMENTPTTTPHVPKLHISITDSWDTDILAHLGSTTEFIKQALAENDNNKVLVRPISMRCVDGYLIYCLSIRCTVCRA